MSSTRLEVKNFGIRTASGIDFHLAPGQSMGLSGPSGAGKTLLLRALADLDPHQGEMWLDGVAADDIPVDQWRRQVALLPAESAWWHDTVGAHFRLQDESWLSDLGFGPEVMTWQINRLSSGERQRLSLLRLLVLHPKVLLLDEPTANLDTDSTALVEALLRQYRNDRQPAIVWVSHNPAQLHRNCDRTCLLQNGGFSTADPISVSERGAP
ncbi:MAG: ATP-binding cassette domain-containing protein [Desulfobacteraceae bacterium]